MKHTPSLFAAMALLTLLSLPAEAQRKAGGNPFGDFHKNDALAPGKPAPRLFAQDTEGKEVDLRDYMGQWVFLEFGSYT